MLLTIHNLPIRTQYSDVKELIISKCGLHELILDNLKNEGSGKRVTVGVIEEEDAALVVRKINGLYFGGQQLYVEDIRQKKDSEQPYRTSISQSKYQTQQSQYQTQQSQYQTQQSEQGYEVNTHVQGMFQPIGNYQPMLAIQAVQNSYMDYGRNEHLPVPSQQLSTHFGGPVEYEYAQPYTKPGAFVASGGLQDAGDAPPLRPQPWTRDVDRQDFRDNGTNRSDRIDQSHDRFDNRSRRPYLDCEPDSRADMRANKRGNIRGDMQGDSRGITRGDMRNDVRGDMRNDMRGDMPNEMRGDMRNAYDFNESNPQFSRDISTPNTWNAQGGDIPDSLNARGGHESRGGHQPNSRNRRGGYEPTVQSGPVYYTRHDSHGHASQPRDDRPRNALPRKRRWEDNTQESYDRRPERPPHDRELATTQRPSRATHREPRPERTALGPTSAFIQGLSAAKLLRGSKICGVNKLLYEIAHNLNIMAHITGPNPVKSGLRRALMTRVNEIVGTEILQADEIRRRYRELYPKSEDFDLYTDITRSIADNTVTTQKQQVQEKKEFKGAQFKKFKKEAPRKERKIPPVPPGKIPNYPQGDKRIFKQQKRQQKEEMATLKPFQVDATLQKAIEEETELIAQLMKKEFKNTQNKQEIAVYEKIDQEYCVDQCKKLLTYHITKRVSGGGVKLLRIYGRPKPPNRTDMAAFLMKYHCLSLKKSVKSPFYTASFDSYKTIDRLCAMEPVEIGAGNFVTFRYMNGNPTPKYNQKYGKFLRKKLINNLIDKSEVNLLNKDWQSQMDEEKKSNSDSAVVINIGKVKVKKENVEETKKVKEENNDFLHEDFKVIDEVRESDNDDAVVNDVSTKGNRKGESWDEVGEEWGDADDDWGDVTGVKPDVEKSAVVKIENDSDDINLSNGDDDDDDDEEGINIGNIDIDDIDVDDDDLEDY